MISGPVGESKQKGPIPPSTDNQLPYPCPDIALMNYILDQTKLENKF